MIKYFISILVVLILLINPGFCQDGSKYQRYFAKDQLSFSFLSSQLIQNKSNIGISAFSRGINLQMMYPVIGSKNNVALALGFGLACQNYYLDNFINYNTDSVWFTPIPDSLDHRKYKLNTNYFFIPVELRFKTNPNHENKSLKFYLGFRAGVLINSHIKYVGRDRETEEKIKEKQFYIKHINSIDYGITLRVGKGKFMANGYYSLSALFETDKCCKMVPYEIGLTLVLF